MRPSTIWPLALLILMNLGCKSITLAFKNIEYPEPSRQEMRQAYAKQQSLYDSMAALAFAMFDNPKSDSCITGIVICKSDFSFVGEAGGGCPLLEISGIMRQDDIFVAQAARLQSLMKAAKVPACIAVGEDEVRIPYKKRLETIKHIYYKQFIYVRPGKPLRGDTIGDNVFTE